MIELWNSYLYEPTFNFLIWIYNGWSEGNMGWAVIYLTIVLRFAILPLSVVEQRDKAKNKDLEEEIQRINRELKDDHILRKDEIRRTMKRRKIHPWVKFLSLAIQALVLLLLYQVFVDGVTGEKISEVLYSSIQYPGVINTDFYGFDLAAKRDLFWSLIITLWLAAEIYFKSRKSGKKVSSADLAYFILFPLAVFLLLYFIPMVKSLFILTSMVFSVIVGGLIRLIYSGVPKKPKPAKK